MNEPRVIYNNGALKIIHHPSVIIEFELYFDLAGVKKQLFLTKEQFEIMQEEFNKDNFMTLNEKTIMPR